MAETYKAITNIPGWVDLLTSDGVPDSIAALYSRVPILYRAIQLRCDALSTVPFRLVKGESEIEWQYPTSLSRLLWQWEAGLLLRGAAYGEIIANKSGIRKDIQYRNPFDMNVQYMNTGELVFKQNSSGATWTNDLRAGKYEMLYIAEYDPTQDILPGVGAGRASTIDAKML